MPVGGARIIQECVGAEMVETVFHKAEALHLSESSGTLQKPMCTLLRIGRRNSIRF